PARMARKIGAEKWLPKFFKEMISLVPRELASASIPEISAAEGVPRGRVGFVTGCAMSVMFGKTNAASVRLLNRAGYEVVAPKGQGCCGALFAHSGNLKEARNAARKNMEAFEKANV